MRRLDGGIPVTYLFGYLCQWGRGWAALGKRDLHIVFSCLNMGLHALHKIFIAQINLP